MTPRSFRRNTAFNLVGGGLMMLYALLLPSILSRAMTTEAFGAYILGLQFVPFLMLLATPIQQSLAPRFARLNADGRALESVELFRISIRLLGAVGVIAVIVSIAASLLLPVVLGWRPEFAVVASNSIAILGIAAALSFPVFAVTSFASGRQDFLWENLLKCSGPFGGLALVSIWMLLSSKIGIQLVPQHIIYLFATATVAAALAIGVLGSGLIPLKGAIFGKLDRSTFFTHLGAARGVLWWQLCALLTMSVAPFIVSSVEPTKVAAFSVTASLMSVIAGLSSALAGPFAVKMGQYAAGDVESRTNIFLKLQRPFQAFLIGSTCVILMLPASLFNWWVGSVLAQQIPTLIVPLALANLFRQMTGPYTTALLGLGQQNKLWLSPAAEAAGSVVFGVLLGKYFGATGVAYGILAASSLRLILTAIHDLPATRAALHLTMLDIVLPYRIDFFKSRA